MSKENRNLTELIFNNIKKTHQAPQCKICKKAFPRLNQETGICDSCKSKETMLSKFLKKK